MWWLVSQSSKTTSYGRLVELRVIFFSVHVQRPSLVHSVLAAVQAARPTDRNRKNASVKAWMVGGPTQQWWARCDGAHGTSSGRRRQCPGGEWSHRTDGDTQTGLGIAADRQPHHRPPSIRPQKQTQTQLPRHVHLAAAHWAGGVGAGRPRVWLRGTLLLPSLLLLGRTEALHPRGRAEALHPGGRLRRRGQGRRTEALRRWRWRCTEAPRRWHRASGQ